MTNLKPNDRAIWAPYSRRPMNVIVKRVTATRVSFYKKPEWVNDPERIRTDIIEHQQLTIDRLSQDIKDLPWPIHPYQKTLPDYRAAVIKRCEETMARHKELTHKELLDTFLQVSTSIHERVFKGQI